MLYTRGTAITMADFEFFYWWIGRRFRRLTEVRVAVVRLQVAGHAGTGVRVLEERQHHCHCQSQYDHVGSHTCKSRQ
jgi:hypothetical protein